VWKHRDTHKNKIGKIATIKKPHGYLAICIDSKYYYAHRLAWMYVYGEFPKVIDHIDANKENNKADTPVKKDKEVDEEEEDFFKVVMERMRSVAD
jgi:hypothetical protein